MVQQVQDAQQNKDEEMGYYTPGELTVGVRHPAMDPEVLLTQLREELSSTCAACWHANIQGQSLLLQKPGLEPRVLDTALNAKQRLHHEDLKRLQEAVAALGTQDIITFPTGQHPLEQLSLAFLRLENGNNIHDHCDTLGFMAAELTLRQQGVVKGSQGLDSPGINIVGISPGWRFAGAQPGGNLISGGPGAKPVPPDGEVNADDAQIKLVPFPGPTTPTAEAARERLAQKLQKNGKCLEEVDVYMLDTVPPYKHLQHINQQCGLPGHNEWIASLLKGFPTDCPGNEAEIHGERLHVYYTEQDPEIKIKDHSFEMSDHGFFAAGLIHALAPTATIHLIQVLNNCGAGTMRTLAWGLKKALEMIQERGRPAVINCSLTLGIDFDYDGDDDTLEHFLTAAHHWLLSPLNEIFGILDNVAPVVAAAGNDGKADRQKALTRFPAAYEQVVGVGALQRDLSRAPYTNVPDNPEWQGFVVFGGELEQTPHTNCDITASATDGILSVYSAPHFPCGATNKSGWARWAGTSFAAPLVSGALAQLLATGMSRDEAIKLLREAVEEPCPNYPHTLPLWQGK